MITVTGDQLNAGPGTSFQWYLNNSKINGAIYQNHQATVSGRYSVVVVNTNGCSPLSSDTIQFYKTSLSEAIPGNTFTIFPNPATNTISVSFSTNANPVFEITDLKGTQLKNYQVNKIDDHLYELNLQNLSEGVYLIGITQNHSKQFRKIVKLTD